MVGDWNMWKGASEKFLMACGQISFKKMDFKKSNLNLLYMNTQVLKSLPESYICKINKNKIGKLIAST